MSKEQATETDTTAEESTRPSVAVTTVFAEAAALSSDEYLRFADTYASIIGTITDLKENYLIDIAPNAFKLGKLPEAEVVEGEEVEEAEEVLEDYTEKVRSILNTFLALSYEDMVVLDELCKDLRTIRRLEKDLGFIIGDGYIDPASGKEIGKVLDLKKGRKIIIGLYAKGTKDLTKKRRQVIPAKSVDLEDDE